MIEFKGELSNKTKEFLLRIHKKEHVFSASIALIVLGVISLIMFVFMEEIRLIICSCFLTGIIIVLLLLVLPNKKDKLNIIKEYVSNSIVIQDDYIEREGEGTCSYACEKIEDVKSVFDYGTFYHIKFYFPVKDKYFILQKDLITQGTIEEFEEIFADLIVRKID